MADKYFIYGLKCPVDNKIRYIGRSLDPDNRLHNHLVGANRNNKAKNLWLQSLINKGLKPELVVIEETNEEFACIAEKYWINHYKDTLFNELFTSGGGKKGRDKKNIVIDFKGIIHAYNLKHNTNLNLKKVAEEMNTEGIYGSFLSARNMIQNFQRGKIKSYPFNLLQFLIKRFEINIDDIIK
jgi:hypothetical protein